MSSDLCATLYGWCHLVNAYGDNHRPGSLPPGLWCDSLHVTCGLTACTPGSALQSPTLVNEYGRTLPFYLYWGRLYIHAAYCNTRYCIVASRSLVSLSVE